MATIMDGIGPISMLYTRPRTFYPQKVSRNSPRVRVDSWNYSIIAAGLICNIHMLIAFDHYLWIAVQYIGQT